VKNNLDKPPYGERIQKALRELYKTYPDNPLTLLAMGLAEVQDSNTKKAGILHLQAAYAVGTKNLESLKILAQNAAVEGDYVKAAKLGKERYYLMGPLQQPEEQQKYLLQVAKWGLKSHDYDTAWMAVNYKPFTEALDKNEILIVSKEDQEIYDFVVRHNKHPEVWVADAKERMEKGDLVQAMELLRLADLVKKGLHHDFHPDAGQTINFSMGGKRWSRDLPCETADPNAPIDLRPDTIIIQGSSLKKVSAMTEDELKVVKETIVDLRRQEKVVRDNDAEIAKAEKELDALTQVDPSGKDPLADKLDKVIQEIEGPGGLLSTPAVIGNVELQKEALQQLQVLKSAKERLKELAEVKPRIQELNTDRAIYKARAQIVYGAINHDWDTYKEGTGILEALKVYAKVEAKKYSRINDDIAPMFKPGMTLTLPGVSVSYNPSLKNEADPFGGFLPGVRNKGEYFPSEDEKKTLSVSLVLDQLKASDKTEDKDPPR
jgi:tetratricopeptide (TPR) repeat protein